MRRVDSRSNQSQACQYVAPEKPESNFKVRVFFPMKCYLDNVSNYDSLHFMIPGNRYLLLFKWRITIDVISAKVKLSNGI